MASKSVILIVVISLLFIIAGVVGWYLYQTHQQAAQTASNQQVQTMISQLTDLSKQLDTSQHTITQEGRAQSASEAT
jgi:predicted negative regulator of RcsB-dependent stress response